MGACTQVVVWLNALANATGAIVLAPVAVLPGWLSATLAAAVTGVLLLVVFKYTSNQRAIKRARDEINANLLALKLFKESAAVAVQAQGRILVGACRLFLLALVPMAVMTLPVMLVLGQLALWYQARPLHTGEHAGSAQVIAQVLGAQAVAPTALPLAPLTQVIASVGVAKSGAFTLGEHALLTLALNGDADAPWPEVKLQPTDAAQVAIGPVRVLSKREVCWDIQPQATGYQHLVFQVGNQTVEKEIAAGDGFLRVSAERPSWDVVDVLLNPWEKPFAADSPVRSITLDYPRRESRTSGTNWWVGYWFVVSMVAAFALRRVLNVHV
jgi:hypothetical protein